LADETSDEERAATVDVKDASLDRKSRGPPNDLVASAYKWYTGGKPRESWDPLAMLYAIEGLGDVFEAGNNGGYNSVDPKTGRNEWVDKPAGTRHEYLRLKVSSGDAAARLDSLYLDAAWAAFDRIARDGLG